MSYGSMKKTLQKKKWLGILNNMQEDTNSMKQQQAN